VATSLGVPRAPRARAPDDRYVGDYALFMSGLFRPFVERGGYLGYYLDEGARAYLRKVRFPGLADADPVRAFAREIDGVLHGLSRN